MPYRFGDVVLVSFPFTNQATTKKRPGTVISSGDYNRARRDVILMAITSRLGGGSLGFGEFLVQDWHATRLLKPSAIKPVLTTLEQDLVVRALGRLSARDQQSLRETIARLFG